MKPEKSLTVGKKKSGGRNHDGRMTVRRRGVDTSKLIVSSISKEIAKEQLLLSQFNMTQKNAFIALIAYEDGEKRYVIAQNGMKKVKRLFQRIQLRLEIGNTMKLKTSHWEL